MRQAVSSTTRISGRRPAAGPVRRRGRGHASARQLAAKCGTATRRWRQSSRELRGVELDLVNQRVAPVSMEPRSIVASFDAGSGRLTVRISNQMPTAVAAGLAGALGLPQDRVHVLIGDVGGGFGMKTGIYPEDIVVAHAARSLGRAVRWQAERSEDFLSASHGRDVASRAELALDAAGKVLALRVHSLANVGAYATATGVVIQLLIGPWVSTSVYDIPAIDLHLQAVLSHTTPTGAYRGAGRPEAIYLIERCSTPRRGMSSTRPSCAAQPARRKQIRTRTDGRVYDATFEKISSSDGLALEGYGERARLHEKGPAARPRHPPSGVPAARVRGKRQVDSRPTARSRSHRAEPCQDRDHYGAASSIRRAIGASASSGRHDGQRLRGDGSRSSSRRLGGASSLESTIERATARRQALEAAPATRVPRRRFA